MADVQRSSGSSFDRWFYEIDSRNRDFRALASDERVVEIVKRRTNKSIGRTPDIPLLHKGHETGYFVALSIRDGAVALDYRSIEGLPAPYGITHKDDLVPPLALTCSNAECGEKVSRNIRWLFRAAIEALVKTDPTKRPAIRLTSR